jgi:ribosomal protein S12 methylthiotransferase
LRILYAYPDGLDEDLLSEMATNPKIAHYLDVPIQHASNEVLSRMNRRGSREELLEVFSALRRRIPGIVLRSTVLVGFPGETEAQFEELISFLEEVRFDRLGTFIFSPEEGTPAAGMTPKVHPRTAARRYRLVMERQQRISLEIGQASIGSTRQVLVESVDSDGVFYLGRSHGEAPEIDPSIHIAGTSRPLVIGEIVSVKIVDASEYDLTGVTLT